MRDDAKQLFAQKDDESIRKTVQQLLRSKRHRDNGLLLECGQAWDPIHRALTGGTLSPDAGEFPLDHCVLGGRQLHAGDGFDAIMIRPDIVPHVAQALHELKREEFHARYMTIDPADYGKQPNEAESDQAWGKLKSIRQLFEEAGNEHAAVLFTVERSRS